jgi:hypothetical protein
MLAMGRQLLRAAIAKYVGLSDPTSIDCCLLVACRHSSKLSDLSLELRPASITASMQDMHLAEDAAAAAAAAAGTPAVPCGAGLWWPQQLTSLQLGFQGK